MYLLYQQNLVCKLNGMLTEFYYAGAKLASQPLIEHDKSKR